MWSHLRPAVMVFALMTLLTGFVYPLAMTGLSQTLWRAKANGSMILRDGQIIGSALIGQPASSDKYFWPRPSAAGDGYAANASSGSNLGPISQKLMDRIAADAARLKAANGVASLPQDAVTTSGSGLDPDISPDYAALQVARVAKARNVAQDEIARLVEDHTGQPVLGLFGEPRVNVLLLNLALDRR